MATPQTFKLPDLGEGLTEAEIINWLVSAGQPVALNDPLVEVETSKATVEIPSPFAGTVAELHAAPGEVVAVGNDLITILVSQDVRTSSPDFPVPKPGAVPDMAPGVIPDADADEASGNVLVGYGTSVRSASRRRRTAPAGDLSAELSVPMQLDPQLDQASHQAKPRATPPVRKLAKSLGVELDALGAPGTTVSRQDVLDAASASRPAQDAAAASRPAQPANGANTLALRGLRKTIAANVSRSRREIPEATTWVEINATELWSLRHQLTQATGQKVSPLAVICRAVTAALRSYPILNSRLDEANDQIVMLDDVHLGIAASTERGLLVPVVRDAHRLSILRLGAEIQRLTEQARAGSLKPGELTGSSFTVNNYGVLGVDGGNPIINHPEAAILGIGRIIDRPWVVDGALAICKVTELVLAFDHRICDGREAGGFLRLVADMLEDPHLLTANL